MFSRLQRRETPSQPGKQLPSQDGQVGLAFPPAPHRRPPQLLGRRAFQDPGRTAHSCRGGLGPNGPCVQRPAGARDARPCLEPSPERSPRQKQREALGKPGRAWIVAQCPGKSNDAEPEPLSRGVCPPGVCGGGGLVQLRGDSLRWPCPLVQALRSQPGQATPPSSAAQGAGLWPQHPAQMRAYSAPHALC